MLIVVEGFYNDTKEDFVYYASIGATDEENIFYEFESSENVVGVHEEFTVTSYRKFDN